MNMRLYYAHDPMCAWCWGFRPAWQGLQDLLSASVQVERLLGGLAADNEMPMDPALQRYLQDTWQRIEQAVPGTRFNFDFWESCRPRRSTYPACRAVLAAREQGSEWEEPMILAIQQAYYLQARNPSDQATLIELAQEIGLDSGAFYQTLGAAQTQQSLLQEINHCRRMGLTSFPSLALEVAGRIEAVTVNYTDPVAMLEQIEQQHSSGAGRG